MLENIVRHMEMGKTPLQAALDGSREIGFTIISMTLSLAAVFIPVLFMGGIVGRLFHEFAVTIGVAILVSGFVSLTLTPMLCSRFLQAARARARTAALYTASERVFDGMLRRSTSARCAWRCGTGASCSWRSSRVIVGDRVPVRARCRRASSRARTPGQIFVLHRGGAGHLASTRWSSMQQQVADIVAQDPNVDGVHVVRRRRRLAAPR